VKRLLFITFLLLGTAEISLVFGETAQRKDAVELQSKHLLKKQNRHYEKFKKQRKGSNFFTKIKSLFSKRKRKRKASTQTYLIWTIMGAVAMTIGSLAQFLPLIGLGIFLGGVCLLLGLIILITGNGDWKTGIGLLLAFASLVVPLFLLIRSFD